MRLIMSDRRLGKVNIFGEEHDGGDDSNNDGGQNNQKNPPAEKPKTFTQEDVNRMMKADKDRAKKENDALQRQLQAIQEQGLTPENLSALQSRIDELENFGKSQEQLAKEAQSKMQKQYEKDLKAARDGEAHWKTSYETYRLDTEIQTAARDKKATNPDQVLAILKPKSVLRPILGEDKKPTGGYETRVLWKETGEDGQPLDLELSITDAVARMHESPLHGNLFQSGSVGGLGGYQTGAGSKNKKDPGNMTMDEYVAHREAELKKKGY